MYRNRSHYEPFEEQIFTPCNFLGKIHQCARAVRMVMEHQSEHTSIHVRFIFKRYSYVKTGTMRPYLSYGPASVMMLGLLVCTSRNSVSVLKGAASSVRRCNTLVFQ